MKHVEIFIECVLISDFLHLSIHLNLTILQTGFRVDIWSILDTSGTYLIFERLSWYTSLLFGKKFIHSQYIYVVYNPETLAFFECIDLFVECCCN